MKLSKVLAGSFLGVATVAALSPSTAEAAVILNNYASVHGSSDSATDGRTLSLTVNPGADVVLLVGTAYRPTGTPDYPSAQTFGDVPLVLVDSGIDARGAQLWFLALGDVAAETTGTVTFTHARIDWMSQSAIVFNGAKQQISDLIVNKSVSPGLNATTFSSALSNVPAGAMGFDVLGVNAASETWTPDAAQTMITNLNGDSTVLLATSYKGLAIGDNSFSWSGTDDGRGAHIAAAVVPVPEPSILVFAGIGAASLLLRRRRA